MVIDFNAKKEEELMDITAMMNAAEDSFDEMTGESGPFNDEAMAADFCAVLNELGNYICMLLPNGKCYSYGAYSPNDPFVRDGVDVYEISETESSLSEFVSELFKSGMAEMAAEDGVLSNPKKADRFCDGIINEANNKLCIPVANGWYLVYQIHDEMPEKGINVIDIFKAMTQQAESK